MADGASDDSTSLEGARRRASTATSSFGVSRREGPDASIYYTSRLNEGLVSSRDVGQAAPFPDEHVNTVLCGDSRALPLPDNCVHLVVTSPPYNASKDYDEDLSLREYLTLLHEVFAECYRVLTPGGRMVVNVANLGRKPYIPLSSHINIIMHEIGFLMRGEIIWDKSASAGSSCAWGSFQSASNPCLATCTSTCSCFPRATTRLPRSKKRARGGSAGHDCPRRFHSTHQVDLVLSNRASISGQSSRTVPGGVAKAMHRNVHLHRRCGSRSVQRFRHDVRSAKMHGRRYLGVDLSADYCDIAEARLASTPAPSLEELEL